MKNYNLDRFPKSLLTKFRDSLIKLLDGEDSLGCCGLCRFLYERTDESDRSYSFMGALLRDNPKLQPRKYGVMDDNRKALAKLAIDIINSYLNEDEIVVNGVTYVRKNLE